MRTNTMRTISGVSGALLFAITATMAAQAPSVIRTVLNRADSTRPGYEAVTAKAEFPVSGSTGRHTHPGDEISYVLEGAIVLEIQGAPAKTLKAGEAFFVPAGTIHNATASSGKAAVIANYVVEKGKPLTSPAQ